MVVEGSACSDCDGKDGADCDTGRECIGGTEMKQGSSAVARGNPGEHLVTFKLRDCYGNRLIFIQSAQKGSR